jgi:8-hydroxy-5-deazaflavin:NADPH oxidoreductase
VNVGVIGAGRIGGNCARQLVRAGHDVLVSASRDPGALQATAAGLGARAGTAAEAVAFGDVVIFAVPWTAVERALGEAGPLDGKVVVDTTNQFGRDGWEDLGPRTAAQVNAARMAGARYTKSFNTLTAAFQAEAATRQGAERVVQWLCGDDDGAKEIVSGLIAEMGYVPVDLGGTASCQVMEAPRRAGAVYGEEYRARDADAVLQAVRTGRPIPPPPQY